jgi:thiamine biosynthesis lipoprotein
MGCEVVVGGASPTAAAAVRGVFELYDATFSRFRAGSELNRLNARGGGRMSPLFSHALDIAMWAAEETGGLVDPTVGEAVASAGYDADFGAGLDVDAPPGTPRPADRRRLRRVGPVLRLPPGVRLDLNGVVKALAVDRAAALLGGDGFVAAGGDVATRGAVDVAVGRGAVRVRGGLATSGTTRRRWLRAGRPQHHLIDPRSGAPSRCRWLEVTVCGATCLHADVAAKSALLLDGDGPAWLDERGLPGRFAAESGVVENAAWRAALRGSACT